MFTPKEVKKHYEQEIDAIKNRVKNKQANRQTNFPIVPKTIHAITTNEITLHTYMEVQRNKYNKPGRFTTSH